MNRLEQARQFYTKIAHWGYQEDLPEYLKAKLPAINYYVFYLIFGAAVPAAIVFYFALKLLFPLVIIAIVVLVGIMALMYFKYVNLGRLILGIFFPLVVMTANALMVPAGSPPLVNLYIAQLSFALLNFLIFDLEERRLLALSLVASAGLMLSFNWFNLLIEAPSAEPEVLQHGPVAIFMDYLVVILMFGILGGLSYLNRQSEAQGEKLIGDMKVRQAEMGESEERLKSTVEEIKERQNVETQQNWVAEGLSIFNEILRDTTADDMQTYQRVIMALVDHLGAVQGGFYTTREGVSDKVNNIKLVASTAYGRKKNERASFAVGEGLLGTAYRERRTIVLNNLPNGFANISSGKKETNAPEHMLLVPLVTNERIEGFFEVLSEKPFEPFEVEFTQQIGENLAATIAAHLLNNHTKTLLAATREQAEEMNAQEEEMRQNMEELLATQEEMGRKELQYQQRIQALEQEVEELKKKQDL